MAIDCIPRSKTVRSAARWSWRSIGGICRKALARATRLDLAASLGRLSAIGAVLLVTGCGKPPDDRLSEQAFRQDPRRTFERIVSHFKHQYTGGTIAVPTRFGGAGAKRRLVLRFMVEDVRYTVRGCNRRSEPCTAEMTVKTSTHSSLQRVSPPSGEEPTSSREQGRGGTRRRGDDRANGSATTGTENDKGQRSDVRAAESALRRQNKSREQTCFFSYEDGRWVLTGQLADGSMKSAIEFALARQ